MNLEERIKRILYGFLDTIEQEAISMTGDQRVREKDAARLIGYSHGHFKRLRQEGKGPRRFGLGERKISYYLTDLAEWMVERDEQFNELD